MAGHVKAPGETARRVAANIRTVRTAKGLSMAALARRLIKLGQPIADTAVLKTETGSRRVDVDDLAAFAAALEVPAEQLLYGEAAAVVTWVSPAGAAVPSPHESAG